MGKGVSEPSENLSDSSSAVSVSGEDSGGSTGSPSFGRGEANIAVEWDLAVTQSRNEKLRQRDEVKQFFARINRTESLWDQESRTWLRSFPYLMRREAIPLFESSIGDVFEDYQLHPSYSWLPQGKIAQDPDLMLYRLSCVENAQLQIPHFLMPLGRLFVNAENGNRFDKRCNSNRSRLTRWTGYELFISIDLAVWMVFDEDSFASHARPWYPVSCGITQFCKRGIARLLPSLRDLEHVTVEDVIESIKTTHKAGKMRIDEVEKSEVQKSETEEAQTLSFLLSATSSDRLDMSQDTPSMGLEDIDETLPVRLTTHDPNNVEKVPLSRPDSSIQSTEYPHIAKLHLDKTVAEGGTTDVDGRTPLWHAISSANKVEFEHLISMGIIPLNEQIGSGETPLTLAVASGNFAIVKQLLNTTRVNVNKPNAHGETPLLLALKEKNDAITWFLLKRGEVKIIPKSKNDQGLLVDATIQNAKWNHNPINLFQVGDYLAGKDCGSFEISAENLAVKYPAWFLLRYFRQREIQRINASGLKLTSHKARTEARNDSPTDDAIKRRGKSNYHANSPGSEPGTSSLNIGSQNAKHVDRLREPHVIR